MTATCELCWAPFENEAELEKHVDMEEAAVEQTRVLEEGQRDVHLPTKKKRTRVETAP